jgi:hypothetical protein
LLALGTTDCKERRTLTPQDRDVVSGDEPDHGIVCGRLFGRELDAEIDDPPSLSDLGDDLRRYARRRAHHAA